MTTLEYVKEKQKLWAKAHHIQLVGSRGEHGEKVYTADLAGNLFQGLSPSSRHEFAGGDGNELGGGDKPCKMQALHSSSAIGVNVFEYWKCNGRACVIAKALGLPSAGIAYLQFEQKYAIFNEEAKHPNVDVNIHYQNGDLDGIECKFTEPFQARAASGLKPKYLDDFAHWAEFPALRAYAQISPKDGVNKYLHAAQLIKHTLGMYSLKQDKSTFRLLYLYQPAFFEDNRRYLDELNSLKECFKRDGVTFQFITWQKAIINLAKHIEKSDDAYYRYIVEHYL